MNKYDDQATGTDLGKAIRVIHRPTGNGWTSITKDEILEAFQASARAALGQYDIHELKRLVYYMKQATGVVSNRSRDQYAGIAWGILDSHRELYHMLKARPYSDFERACPRPTGKVYQPPEPEVRVEPAPRKEEWVFKPAGRGKPVTGDRIEELIEDVFRVQS